MSSKRLVLFDIDGTILRGGPLWRECYDHALQHHFPNLVFPKTPFCGKTDIQITREMLFGGGFSASEVEDAMHRILDTYLEQAEIKLQTRAHEVEVLPGVPSLLDELGRHENVVVGLLTGNVRRGAQIKLQSVDLEHHFRFGVFGDDNPDRYQLPTLAQERARHELSTEYNGKQIVIIGDTIHDVNCGKSIGVKSIAVGTGVNIPTEDLIAQNPDYYFKDLSATFEVIQAILE